MSNIYTYHIGEAMETRMVYPAKARTIQARYEQIMYLSGLLQYAGIPKAIWPYCIAQIMFETDDLSSPLAQYESNLSGIKYSKNGYGKKANANGFAVYDLSGIGSREGDRLWAKDYARVLSLGPARPIDATSAADFGNRLLRNGYFPQAEANKYSAGFNAKLRAYVSAVDTYAVANGQKPTGGTIVAPNEVADLQKHLQDKKTDVFAGGSAWAAFQAWATNNPMLAVVAGLGLVVVIKKIID